MSVWMSVVKLCSNRCSSYTVFLWFSLNLARSDLCANTQKNWGTDFRNFDFKMFGEFLKFLSRVSIILTRDIDIANLSVCPSVCPLRSGTRWKRLNISSKFFSPYGSPIILVLLALNIFTKFRRGHPLRGAKYRWSRNSSRFSTNKSLYLANDARYRHSYCRRRIENRTQAFEWHQFQWPWVTSNPDFKVTILLNVR